MNPEFRHLEDNPPRATRSVWEHVLGIAVFVIAAGGLIVLAHAHGYCR